MRFKPNIKARIDPKGEIGKYPKSKQKKISLILLFHLFNQFKTTQKKNLHSTKPQALQQEVIKEILTTEIEFNKNIRFVVEHFIEVVKDDPTYLPSGRFQKIFGNLEDLVQFNTNFLQNLKICRSPAEIAHTFLRFNESFSRYFSIYVANHQNALKELNEIKHDRNDKFKQFIDV